MRKSFLFVALAALALVGCNDKKQSELLEGMLLTDTANISAQFFYNEGEKLVGGVKVSESLPVPETVEVIAQVDYSEYTGAAAGKSYKQFRGTSIGDGTYTFVIPAGEKKINVTIIANGFKADYYLTPENPIKAYYPKKELKEFPVLAGQTFVKNDPTETTFDLPVNPLNNSRTVQFVVSGKLEGQMEVFDTKKNLAKSGKSGLANQTIILTIKSNDAADNRTLEFTQKTDGTGAYSFNDISIYDEWKTALEKDDKALEMKLSVKEWVDENFVHYYKKVKNTKAGKKIWANESAFNKVKKTYETDQEGWSSYLAALTYPDSEGDPQPLYEWDSSNSTKVLGSWKVTSIDVENIQAAVTLFKKAANQNLTATFTPQDVTNVKGVGTLGGDVTIEVKDDKKTDETVDVEIPETVFVNTMGWKK